MTVRQPAARHGANAGIDEEDTMSNDSASRDLPSAKYCGSFRRGHDVHFTQARLTWELRCDEPHVVRHVADDGTITFADGTTVWNHDPQRLRLVLARHGNDVLVSAYGVLQVPNERGVYYFSVADEHDPCRPEISEHRPGESLADELLRRGGLFRSGQSVLDQLRRENQS
jgi:hypothetical protein